MSDNKEETDEKSQSITNIPCMRNSLLTGLSSGIIGGLTYFLFTSNVRMATHVGVGTYAILATASWSFCRYNYSKMKFQQREIRQAFQTAVFQNVEKESNLPKT
ncbi:cytochrome c oxidase assembly protein COX20, mitochondrial [Octopus bimaculoides]|uniref:Cytochrome c oxidase assembly protein COX20, mitochondrial n=1 Tax=Octopus bimaculoides TaxID=37653 RepID=A0A0L8G2T5_OCTBM|nr:cytochrome c oxidase assembly protein COX20, mitochondrial [Octopus bimaculoides]|eukprot:XP_014784912.1 PREDICTED: cytochrome c oxidase protein 20 homolog [Octopus bimaculoides]